MDSSMVLEDNMVVDVVQLQQQQLLQLKHLIRMDLQMEQICHSYSLYFYNT